MKDYDYSYFEKILNRKGLKPIDVSRNTGIATSTLSDWKKGRSTPKEDKIKKISDFLGVSIYELRTGKPPIVIKMPNIPMPHIDQAFDEMMKEIETVYEYIGTIDDGSEIIIEMRKVMPEEAKKRMMTVLQAMFPEYYQTAEKLLNEDDADQEEPKDTL